MSWSGQKRDKSSVTEKMFFLDLDSQEDGGNSLEYVECT
jgi:hypothetical protein